MAVDDKSESNKSKSSTDALDPTYVTRKARTPTVSPVRFPHPQAALDRQHPFKSELSKPSLQTLYHQTQDAYKALSRRIEFFPETYAYAIKQEGKDEPMDDRMIKNVILKKLLDPTQEINNTLHQIKQLDPSMTALGTQRHQELQKIQDHITYILPILGTIKDMADKETSLSAYEHIITQLVKTPIQYPTEPGEPERPR